MIKSVIKPSLPFSSPRLLRKVNSKKNIPAIHEEYQLPSTNNNNQNYQSPSNSFKMDQKYDAKKFLMKPRLILKKSESL